MGLFGWTSMQARPSQGEQSKVFSETNFETGATYFGGWCGVKVYELVNGGWKLVKYSYTYEESEAICRSKAAIMELEASWGI